LLPWHGGNYLRVKIMGPMGLDDMRSILLSERETGRLIAVAPDLFDRGHEELASLIIKVYAFEDPLSDEARSFIEETLAIKETLRELFAIRSRKILALTIMHAEGNYYDREEVKRMIPVEREMFESVTASIEQCKGILLHNVPHYAKSIGTAETDTSIKPGSDQEEDLGNATGLFETPLANAPLLPSSVIVRVLEDMESFMGIDGRIYTLSKGDIVTLPERNAAVLSERNIVLNMNLCK
jgi:DNA replication factor GINS